MKLIDFWWGCREIMHAMWKPQKFKAIYLLATLYVLTLTLPSASAVYWAFGDMLLNHSNAFALFPKSPFRDMAVVLMLIHQASQSAYLRVFDCLLLIYFVLTGVLFHYFFSLLHLDLHAPHCILYGRKP